MNWIDIIIIVVLLISFITGLKSGAIKMVLGLVGVILGIILAGRYHPLLAQSLPSASNIASVIAFVIILVGVMIVAAIVAAVLRKAVSLVLLGWVDNLAGGALGLLLGAFFCGALLAILASTSFLAGSIADSKLAAFLLGPFSLVLALLPSSFGGLKNFFGK